MNVSSLSNYTSPSLRLRSPTGFWGQPTATVDWCEPNYQHSFYIAEFWNTVSNLLFVILGLYGLVRSMKQGFEWRFHTLFLSVIITGFGSAMFHGTLQQMHQQFDETPMIWGILVWIYIVFENEYKKLGIPNAVVVAALTIFGGGFALLHSIYHFTLVFQLFFGILAWLCLFRLCGHYAQVKDPRAKAVARSFLRNTLLGFGFWMLDYHYCSQLKLLPFNPQGHAWWHILVGIGSYHGPVFMQYVRMEQQQKKAEIVDVMYGIHTIVVHTDEDMANIKPKSL
ncbi:hypothetical protein Poli38472_002933 [Pythium oligandrum]|uniref:Alkaline phytoceramidase n=1 Tax=Pythium oligandrum TaxID=41045 RepID=A0A8K1C659_PYTOL|nr:hypothetical protein Poli38472_002933 [Pythium oligandrum]|eukprot:TMW57008.1 hypothetical protein Poli38472_002933 [Pythium oligandrum]